MIDEFIDGLVFRPFKDSEPRHHQSADPEANRPYVTDDDTIPYIYVRVADRADGTPAGGWAVPSSALPAVKDNGLGVSDGLEETDDEQAAPEYGAMGFYSWNVVPPPGTSAMTYGDVSCCWFCGAGVDQKSNWNSLANARVTLWRLSGSSEIDAGSRAYSGPNAQVQMYNNSVSGATYRVRNTFVSGWPSAHGAGGLACY
jgi:hypothetical protein